MAQRSRRASQSGGGRDSRRGRARDDDRRDRRGRDRDRDDRARTRGGREERRVTRDDRRGGRDDRRGAGFRRRPKPTQKLPLELIQRFQADPSFRIFTLDKQQWICPFNGEAVSAPGGDTEAIQNYLLDSAAWKDAQPLPLQQLIAIRWRHDLLRLLPQEPRLRIFGKEGQGWLNPYNGEFSERVSREDGRINMRTVTAMAQVLAACPQAQAGVMLDAQQLEQRQRALSGSQHDVNQASQPGSGHGTVFGLSDDLKRAKDVQANMLSDLPELDGYEMAVHFTPHSGVSGDFYEVLKLGNGRFLFLLGDVSGHGMQAALVVATALKTLRMLARAVTDLTELMGQLNDEIKPDLLPGQFITIFAAIFDPVASNLTCVLAGHHQLLIANPDADLMLRKIGKPGMAVGLLAGQLFRKSLKPEVVQLNPGDIVLQYTDGLIEAINEEDEEFGVARVCGSLMANCMGDMQSMVDSIASEVVEFAGGAIDDDLTLLAIARDPEGQDSGDSDSDR